MPGCEGAATDTVNAPPADVVTPVEPPPSTETETGLLPAKYDPYTVTELPLWLTEMCACGLQAHAIAAGTTSIESARRVIDTRRRLRTPRLP